MTDTTNTTPVAPLFTVEMINRAVDAMVKAQANMVKSVAQVIVMALWSANVGNSADVANTLIRNLRKGVRKQAVIDLLEANGNLAYASGSFVHFAAPKHGWTEDEVKAYKLAAVNWETFKKVTPEAKMVDAIEALDELVSKLEKKDDKKELNHPEVLEQIKALLGKLKAGELVG